MTETIDYPARVNWNLLRVVESIARRFVGSDVSITITTKTGSEFIVNSVDEIADDFHLMASVVRKIKLRTSNYKNRKSFDFEADTVFYEDCIKYKIEGEKDEVFLVRNEIGAVFKSYKGS
ncbi:hypothetical protein, partial [Umezakia ovalisporum]|uniref:hypothetical protein n=1 Tax=Umezakia ovalisporum TaxID=75695 RepID=UPI0039C64525